LSLACRLALSGEPGLKFRIGSLTGFGIALMKFPMKVYRLTSAGI